MCIWHSNIQHVFFLIICTCSSRSMDVFAQSARFPLLFCSFSILIARLLFFNTRCQYTHTRIPKALQVKLSVEYLSPFDSSHPFSLSLSIYLHYTHCRSVARARESEREKQRRGKESEESTENSFASEGGGHSIDSELQSAVSTYIKRVRKRTTRGFPSLRFHVKHWSKHDRSSDWFRCVDNRNRSWQCDHCHCYLRWTSIEKCMYPDQGCSPVPSAVSNLGKQLSDN